MAIPGYLHLGFFVEGSFGQWRSRPRVVTGPQTEALELCVRDLLGVLPEGLETEGPICWDKYGQVVVSLWGLVREADLVRKLLEVQRRSQCQVVERRGISSHLVHPNYLESLLRYYVEEFGEVVARWQKASEERVRSEEA